MATPMRRVYTRRSWSWVATRLFQLWNLNPFWFLLFLCVSLSYLSQEAYLQLAQELRPDNPQCSSSRTCLHLQVPLHLALLGSMLCMFMLYLIIKTIFRPEDHVSGDVSISAAGLRDRYRRRILMVTIPSFVVLVLIEWYDTAVPWISGCCAGFRVGLIMAYVILMVNWWNTAVAEEMDEQPAQELENI